jgi:hypothetical protein
MKSWVGTGEVVGSWKLQVWARWFMWAQKSWFGARSQSWVKWRVGTGEVVGSWDFQVWALLLVWARNSTKFLLCRNLGKWCLLGVTFIGAFEFDELGQLLNTNFFHVNLAREPCPGERVPMICMAYSSDFIFPCFPLVLVKIVWNVMHVKRHSQVKLEPICTNWCWCAGYDMKFEK